MQTSDQLSASSAARVEEPVSRLVMLSNRFITRRILTAVSWLARPRVLLSLDTQYDRELDALLSGLIDSSADKAVGVYADRRTK